MASTSEAPVSDVRYSHPRRLVSAVVCIGVFMLLLCGIIVNDAMPDIRGAFARAMRAISLFSVIMVFAGTALALAVSGRARRRGGAPARAEDRDLE